MEITYKSKSRGTVERVISMWDIMQLLKIVSSRSLKRICKDTINAKRENQELKLYIIHNSTFVKICVWVYGLIETYGYLH